MRNHALVLVVLFGLSALIAGCPFFTRRDRGEASPAAHGGAAAPHGADEHEAH